jgi:uncharacterized OsmC-like protein
MATQDIAAAIRRMEVALRRRPGLGLGDDSPASASLQGGTRVLTRHESGAQVMTDMPCEFGGSGDQVTPGWLFRAGLASCLATCIAMRAAAAGIELTSLEVRATSRSDTRGLLGMMDAAGDTVCAAPCEVQLVAQVSAPGTSPEHLRILVEESYRCAPVPTALRSAVPVTLRVAVGPE